MVGVQHHRGPDYSAVLNGRPGVALGHNRLSILDLSTAGHQPMVSGDGRLRVAFNGEIYNYEELRRELNEYPFRSRTDTEVILAAYERWGDSCLNRFYGMFAFLLWDDHERRLLAARDRFGVKPLYYHQAPDGRLLVASEIKAFWAAGVAREPDEVTWASYLTYGVHENTGRTFWKHVHQVPPGHKLVWQDGRTRIEKWYDIAGRIGTEFDNRTDGQVADEYLALLEDSVRLRFRSDVPVGINLSGGLDSSLLLGLVHRIQGQDSDVRAYTFVTGDDRYDELPWVRQMLDRTQHPHVVCRLDVSEVPSLAEDVQRHQDEPFGGLPTLAYAKVFEQARADGTIVLLDGQGMDEQWAGYDYYETAGSSAAAPVVQGGGNALRPDCLTPEFRALAEPLEGKRPFGDRLRDMQYRDITMTKIPRALRFNDRVSMRSSTELREPFLDHRLVELAMRQPANRKIRDGVRKWLPRHIAKAVAPQGVVEAPKRPLQTPQREWLQGPLREWALTLIEEAVAKQPWFRDSEVKTNLNECEQQGISNSFFIWQWVSIRLLQTI